MRTIPVYLSRGEVVQVVFDQEDWYVTDGDGFEVDQNEFADSDRSEIEIAIECHLQELGYDVEGDLD